MRNHKRLFWSSRTNFSILMIFAALGIAGVLAIPFLKAGQPPSEELNAVKVSYNCYNMGPKAIEDQVTSKLEAILTTIKGVNSVHSVSGPGYGAIDLYLDPGLNEHETTYDIATLVRQTYKSFPSGVSFPDIRSNRSSADQQKQVLRYAMTGGQAAVRFINGVFKPRILAIKGVEQLISYGDRSYVWALRYDPYLLKKYGIDLNDVSRRIRTYLGRFEIGMSRVRSEQKSTDEYAFLTLEVAHGAEIRWEKVIIGTVDGRHIPLTEIFKPVLEEQKRSSFHRINGADAIDVQVIVPEQQAIFSKTITTIQRIVAELAQKMPEGVSMANDNEPGKEINRCLKRAGLQCLGLFLFFFCVLWLFFRDLKRCAVVLIAVVGCILLFALYCYIFTVPLGPDLLTGLPFAVGLCFAFLILAYSHLTITPFWLRAADLLLLAAVLIGSYIASFFISTVPGNFRELLRFFIAFMVVSLPVALLLIPALHHKLGIAEMNIPASDVISLPAKYYTAVLRLMRHRRKVICLLALCAFGIPFSLLPRKADKWEKWGDLYNSTLGTKRYRNKIKPWLSTLLGGTFDRYLTKPRRYIWNGENANESRLFVHIAMPYGTDASRMNKMILSLETQLTKIKGLKRFESSVFNGQNADLNVRFDSRYSNKGLPYQLKSAMVEFATFNGAADLKIFGVGQAFDNEMPEEFSNNSVTIKGYNYPKLLGIGEKMIALLKNYPRAQKISISAKRNTSGKKNDYGLIFAANNRYVMSAGYLSVGSIGEALARLSMDERQTGAYVVTNNNYTPVSLISERSALDPWELLNEPLEGDIGGTAKLKGLYHITNEKSNRPIERNDQEYQIVVNYDFAGSENLNDEVRYNVMFQVWRTLPLGYLITDKQEVSDIKDEQGPGVTVLVALLLLFIISAIALNSISVAIKVNLVVLSSFIGLFFFTYMFGNANEEGVRFAQLTTLGLVQGLAVFFVRCMQRDTPEKAITVDTFVHAVLLRGHQTFVYLAVTLVTMVSYILTDKSDLWYSFSVAMSGALLFSLFSLSVILPVMISKPVMKKNK